jgi:hypothetical protein
VEDGGPCGRSWRQDEVEDADVLAEPDEPPDDEPPDDDPLDEEEVDDVDVDELDELVEAGAGSTLLAADRESVR